jgi:Helicase HerA, central domain/TraM recognition site of TraD and TraG
LARQHTPHNSSEVLSPVHAPAHTKAGIQSTTKSTATAKSGTNFSRLGTHFGWGGAQQDFEIAQADRAQHLYVIGKTGVGKSTFLKNLILQDIDAGRGVGLIDPHGDLVAEILNYIPRHRADDVVLFDAADTDYPPAFNVLAHSDAEDRPLIVSGLVGAFKNIWSDSWGPRLEYVLYACIAALLECQNVTLLGVQRMLRDPHYLSWVTNQIKDPFTAAYWSGEFTQFDHRQIAEVISPIQNKVGQLLMSPLLRNILGQVKRKIDCGFMMNHGRIFLASLPKGALGADKSKLLGAMLVSQFEQAAMARAKLPPHERRDFNLYIDEFQNFSTESFASILSEARKYKLTLTLSHQYMGQLPESLQDAVLGNVGSIVAFRVSEADAHVLSREYGGEFAAHQFSDLENHHALVKLMRDGKTDVPFRVETCVPPFRYVGRAQSLIAQSRSKFTQKRSEVENKIKKWLAA